MRYVYTFGFTINSKYNMEHCRACLSTETTLVPLHKSIVVYYNELTNLNVTLFDNMSQFLCQTCVDTVKFFIKFRKKCILSETKLREIEVNKLEINEDPCYEKLQNINVDKMKDIVIKDVYTILEDCIDKNYMKLNEDLTDAVKSEEPEDVAYTTLENCVNGNYMESNEDLAVTVKSEELEDHAYTALEDCVGENYMELNEDLINAVKSEEPEDFKQKRKRKSRRSKNIKAKKKKSDETEEMMLPCGICNNTFEDQISLNEHLDVHKIDNTCVLCKEIFNDWPQILAHRLKHIPTKLRRCHICSKTSRSILYLEHHYRQTHYEGQMTKLQCKHCFRTYDTPRKLQVHISGMHNIKTYTCDYCSKEFHSKQKMKSHVVAHSGDKSYVCDMCGFSCNFSGGLKAHKLRKHTPSKRTCHVCARVFENQSLLDNHKCKVVIRVCPMCGKQFNKSNLYSRHLHSHAKEPRYNCERCPAKFRTKFALIVHVNKHDGKRNYECEFCQKKFYTPSVLVKHRRIHTGEKPYVCKICDRGFTGNHNLKVHMKIHGEMLIIKKNPEN